jgi:hypothetical protein
VLRRLSTDILQNIRVDELVVGTVKNRADNFVSSLIMPYSDLKR